jgi:hypothetical protein
MSNSTISAVLTLGGLLIELAAIVWILSSVGFWDRWVAIARLRARRLANFFRRLWPWSTPKGKHYEVHASDTARTSDFADGFVQKVTDRPAPKSFEEVGERLNELVGLWNRHEEALVNRAAMAREDVATAREEAKREYEKTQATLRRETEERLAERKQEGLLFISGVVLQIAGAAVLLF